MGSKWGGVGLPDRTSCSAGPEAATAPGGILPVCQALPKVERRFERPGVELCWALLGGVGVIVMGQLWTRDLLLPHRPGAVGPLLELLNQVFIFFPILVVPIIRRQGLATMLLPQGAWASRLGLGLLCGGAALSAFWLVRRDVPGGAWPGIAGFGRRDLAVQVFFEDLAIGIVLYRLVQLAGVRIAVGARRRCLRLLTFPR